MKVDILKEQEIVREADGLAVDYQGTDLIMEPIGNVVAGNPQLAKILTEKYLV